MPVLKYRDTDGSYKPVSYNAVPAYPAMNDLTDADTVASAPAVGDSLVWDGTNWVPGDRVNIAGDTMTGPLTLPADPAVAMHAATKKYVDDLGFRRVSLLPVHYGYSLIAATMVTDSAGNADWQFTPDTYTGPPSVVALPIHVSMALTCVIAEVTTTRCYVTIRNSSGAGVGGIPVMFLAFGNTATPLP